MKVNLLPEDEKEKEEPTIKEYDAVCLENPFIIVKLVGHGGVNASLEDSLPPDLREPGIATLEDIAIFLAETITESNNPSLTGASNSFSLNINGENVYMMLKVSRYQHELKGENNRLGVMNMYAVRE